MVYINLEQFCRTACWRNMGKHMLGKLIDGPELRMPSYSEYSQRYRHTLPRMVMHMSYRLWKHLLTVGGSCRGLARKGSWILVGCVMPVRLTDIMILLLAGLRWHRDRQNTKPYMCEELAHIAWKDTARINPYPVVVSEGGRLQNCIMHFHSSKALSSGLSC